MTLAVILTVPVGRMSCPAAIRAISPTESRILFAAGNIAAPVSVKDSPLACRWNSSTPRAVSTSRTCRPTVGWLDPSVRAAAESEPISATARKARIRDQSRFSIQS